MVRLTRQVETQLKHLGIAHKTLEYCQQTCLRVLPDSLGNIHQRVVNYVAVQSAKIPTSGTFLATSDVIESLFGKYKNFSARCPIQEMGQMLLTICLSTMELTDTVVKNALETTKFTDVEDWLAEVFGQSMLSKRQKFFTTNGGDIKTV